VATPPQSFFQALRPHPSVDVVDAWWHTVEVLAARDGDIAAALRRAGTADAPTFVIELYHLMIDVARLIADLQLTWSRLRAAVVPRVPEEWTPETTDPELHIGDTDPRSHARVYTEVAGLARDAFLKHELPQMYKVVHSPMFMRSTEATDLSPVDSLGEIASALAQVAWYRDFLLQHALPSADTIRWIVREVHQNVRSRAMRHVLLLAYALYDVVIGNDLDGGEG